MGTPWQLLPSIAYIAPLNTREVAATSTPSGVSSTSGGLDAESAASSYTEDIGTDDAFGNVHISCQARWAFRASASNRDDKVSACPLTGS